MGSGRHHSSRKKLSSSSSLKKNKKNKKRYQDRRKTKSTSVRDTSKKRYFDNDSVSTSSTSDDDRSGKRRGRSTASRRVKSRKMRAQRSLSRSESSQDTRKGRKSKGSKESNARRKHQAKKRRREPSVDSPSSQTYSCSTCGSSDDSAESVERTRLRSEKSTRDQKDLYNQRSKNSHLSRSCSCSHDSEGEFESAKHETSETRENQPKRLRSVVFVAEREPTKVRTSDGDGVKDEIVYEHDAYPSCRSNDSNDVGGFEDAAVLSKSERLRIEVPKEKNSASTTRLPGNGESSGGLDAKALSSFSEGMVSVQDGILPSKSDSKGDNLEAILRQKALENLRKFRDRAKDSYDGEVQLPYLKSDSVLDKSVKKQTLGVSLNSDNTGSTKLGGDKTKTAVEGLDADYQSNRSGATGHDAVHGMKLSAVKPSAKLVDGSIITVKDDAGFPTYEYSRSSSTLKAIPPGDLKPDNACPSGRTDFCRITSMEGLITTNPLVKGNVAEGAVNGKCDISILSLAKEPGGSIKSLKQGPASAAAPKGGEQEDGHNLSGRHSVIPLSSKRPATAKPLDDNTTPDPAKYQNNVRTTTSNDEPSRTSKTIEQAPALQESSQITISNHLQQAPKDAVKGSQSVIRDSKVVGEGTLQCETSTSNQNTRGQSNDNGQKERDESSQFQQKTMSVMRGGELVQVNYKVYIPKKAPALARRQLKR